MGHQIVNPFKQFLTRCDVVGISWRFVLSWFDRDAIVIVICDAAGTWRRVASIETSEVTVQFDQLVTLKWLLFLVMFHHSFLSYSLVHEKNMYEKEDWKKCLIICASNILSQVVDTVFSFILFVNTYSYNHLHLYWRHLGISLTSSSSLHFEKLANYLFLINNSRSPEMEDKFFPLLVVVIIRLQEAVEHLLVVLQGDVIDGCLSQVGRNVA